MGRSELLCLLALLSLGCGEGPSPTTDQTAPLLANPLGELPERLSDSGLFGDTSELTASGRLVSYAPAHPLWSDGGLKERLLLLPAGQRISVDAEGVYHFPEGTLVFKTFSFVTPTSHEQVVHVETRLLRNTPDGWEFAAWNWDETGADATLLPLDRSVTRTILSEEGHEVEHVIPSRLECRQCHESSDSSVLGINELQLAGSGDIEELLPFLDPPPSRPYAALPKHGPLTTQVLGYLVGNCVHCHNGSNGAASSFDMRPSRALSNLINKPTESSATADGIRVVPGKRDASILLLGVRGDELEVKDMPPLGVALRDQYAIRLLGDWIEALEEDSDP